MQTESILQLWVNHCELTLKGLHLMKSGNWSIVGMLMYLAANSRHDIAYAACLKLPDSRSIPKTDMLSQSTISYAIQ